MLETIQTLLIIFIAALLLIQRNDWLKGFKKKQLVIDSNGLMDGRIVELAESGFLPPDIVIPRFVLKEMQLLADGKDSLKRERARFGLDVAKKLQNSLDLRVTIHPYVKMHVKADDMLIQLCKKLGAGLYTLDLNLNKIAAVEGVKVLNLNELSHVLRPSMLPGEQLQIKIMQKGSARHQGVGYLDDGTMVVVENAENLVGKTVEVESERMHQTVAGKMIFARLLAQRGE